MSRSETDACVRHGGLARAGSAGARRGKRQWVRVLAGALALLASFGCAQHTTALAPQASAGADRAFNAGVARERVRAMIEALDSGDVDRVLECVFFAPSVADGPEATRTYAAGLLQGRAGEILKRWLDDIDVWSVDDYLHGPRLDVDTLPAGSVRVLCRARPVTMGSEPHDTGIIALFFVRQGGQWRFYWQKEMMPAGGWAYRFNAPEAAFRSLATALDWRDYRMVYELIDPALRPAGMSLDVWMTTVRQRQAAVDKWEKDVAASNARPESTPPPFQATVARGYWAYVDYLNRERTRARVSDVKPAPAWDQVRPYELFARQGDRWYWQPGPEHTLWPLAERAAARSLTTQPVGKADSGPAPAYDYGTPTAALASRFRAAAEYNIEEWRHAQLFPDWGLGSNARAIEILRHQLKRDEDPDPEGFLRDMLRYAVPRPEEEVPARIVHRRELLQYHPANQAPRCQTYLINPPGSQRPFLLRLLYICQDGRWRCMPGGWGFETWTYDLRRPEAALDTVVQCIFACDYGGIYDLLATKPSVRREDYVALMEQREQDLTDGRKPQEYRIQPCLELQQVNAGRVSADTDATVSPRRARVWYRQTEEPDSKRLGCEEFAEMDGQWRWVPKPEYIWNVQLTVGVTGNRQGAGGAPATQPASEARVASGSGAVDGSESGARRILLVETLRIDDVDYQVQVSQRPFDELRIDVDGREIVHRKLALEVHLAEPGAAESSPRLIWYNAESEPPDSPAMVDSPVVAVAAGRREDLPTVVLAVGHASRPGIGVYVINAAAEVSEPPTEYREQADRSWSPALPLRLASSTGGVWPVPFGQSGWCGTRRLQVETHDRQIALQIEDALGARHLLNTDESGRWPVERRATDADARTFTPTYDCSSPEAALASLLRAAEEGNVVELAWAQVWKEWEKHPTSQRVDELARRMRKKGGAELYERVCHYTKRARFLAETDMPLLFSQQYRQFHTGDQTPRCRMYLIEPLDPDENACPLMMRLTFVRQDGGWRLVSESARPETWRFDLRTPEAACDTVVQCVHHQDYGGVYDLLAVRPSIGRERYIELITQRQREVQQNQSSQRWRQIGPHFQLSTAPLLRLTVENDTSGIPPQAKVWIRERDDPDSRREGYELFQLIDGQWRWVPQPDYIWHVLSEPDSPSE